MQSNPDDLKRVSDEEFERLVFETIAELTPEHSIHAEFARATFGDAVAPSLWPDSINDIRFQPTVSPIKADAGSVASKIIATQSMWFETLDMTVFDADSPPHRTVARRYDMADATVIDRAALRAELDRVGVTPHDDAPEVNHLDPQADLFPDE